MKIEINIEKKHAIAIILSLAIFSAANFVFAATPLAQFTPISQITSDNAGFNVIDNGSGYIKAEFIEGGGSSGNTIQHAEDGDASNNARLYVRLDSSPSNAKLTVLAEHSRSMGGDPVDFPVGVVLANSLSSTDPITTGYTYADYGNYYKFALSTHTHIFKYLYNHKHKNGIFKESGGKLPINAKIYINGVERTADITWVTQNPVAEKEKMIDAYDISSYLVSGDNWIEIGSDQAFKARFYLVF